MLQSAEFSIKSNNKAKWRLPVFHKTPQNGLWPKFKPVKINIQTWPTMTSFWYDTFFPPLKYELVNLNQILKIAFLLHTVYYPHVDGLWQTDHKYLSHFPTILCNFNLVFQLLIICKTFINKIKEHSQVKVAHIP